MGSSLTNEEKTKQRTSEALAREQGRDHRYTKGRNEPYGEPSNKRLERRHAAPTLARRKPNKWAQTGRTTPAKGSTASGSRAPHPSINAERSCASLGGLWPNGALEQLLKLLPHGQLQGIRCGADELLAVKCGAQTNHMGRHRQAITKVLAHVVDLAFDGVAGHSPTRPAFGHHGTEPNVKQAKKGLLR